MVFSKNPLLEFEAFVASHLSPLSAKIVAYLLGAALAVPAYLGFLKLLQWLQLI
jgi:hypothetical protein